MARRSTLCLGTVVYGIGQTLSSWLDPRLDLRAEISFDYQRSVVQRAEQACLDFVFIGDAPYCGPASWPSQLSKFEPITLLASLAAVTSHIGLIPSISTSFTEPYNVARQLASLDHLSGGRAGWNVVTTAYGGAAKNFGLTENIEHDERYARAAEHLEVVKGLWDSWDEDAFVRDVAARRYYDPDKLHYLNHVGEHFKVAGPLCIERPPQGYPVISQAGGSPAGIAFAARSADLVYTGGRSYEITRRAYRELKTQAQAAGRSPDEIIVLPGIAPIIGSTVEEAERRFAALRELVSLDEALTLLGAQFGGHDFRQYALDAPFPDLGKLGEDGHRSLSSQIKQGARDRGLSLREVAMEQSVLRSDFIGTPEKIADLMEKWFRDEAADGFVLNVGSTDCLPEFIEHVLPILQQRGLFRREYRNTTFRRNLGLAKPPSRYART